MKNPEYLQEWLVINLSEDILAIMEEENLSRSDLAARLGVSRQYVTKLINRTPNLTLRSLAEIAAALGRQVTVRLEMPPPPLAATPMAEAKSARAEQPPHPATGRRVPARRKRAAAS